MKNKQTLENEIKAADAEAEKFKRLSDSLCAEFANLFSSFKPDEIIEFQGYSGSKFKRGRIIKARYNYKNGFIYTINALKKDNSPSLRDMAFYYVKPEWIKKIN